jgi:hypothetical protein
VRSIVFLWLPWILVFHVRPRYFSILIQIHRMIPVFSSGLSQFLRVSSVIFLERYLFSLIIPIIRFEDHHDQEWKFLLLRRIPAVAGNAENNHVHQLGAVPAGFTSMSW